MAGMTNDTSTTPATDRLAGALPITEAAYRVTSDIGQLVFGSVRATIDVDADRIGLHVVRSLGVTTRQADPIPGEYLTIAPHPDQIGSHHVIMVRLPEPAVQHPSRLTVLDLVLKAVEDDLAGSFEFTLHPDPTGWTNGGAGSSGWAITGATYTDPEGERFTA